MENIMLGKKDGKNVKEGLRKSKITKVRKEGLRKRTIT